MTQPETPEAARLTNEELDSPDFEYHIIGGWKVNKRAVANAATDKGYHVGVADTKARIRVSVEETLLRINREWNEQLDKELAEERAKTEALVAAIKLALHQSPSLLGVVSNERDILEAALAALEETNNA